MPVPAGPRPKTSSQLAERLQVVGPGSAVLGATWPRRPTGRAPAARGVAGARVADGHADVGLGDLQALRRRGRRSPATACLASAAALGVAGQTTPRRRASRPARRRRPRSGRRGGCSAPATARTAASDRVMNSGARLTALRRLQLLHERAGQAHPGGRLDPHRNDLADQAIRGGRRGPPADRGCGRSAGPRGGPAARTAPAGSGRPGWR